MTEDEKAIHTWFENWIKATTEGDFALANSLIADDAVFLMPGFEMGKDDFAQAATATDPDSEFDLKCEVVELEVLGDKAWVRTTTTLNIINKESQSKTHYAGSALSILEKRTAGWVVMRDANTLKQMPEEND